MLYKTIGSLVTMPLVLLALMSPLPATAIVIVEDFESAPGPLFDGTVLSGMEFNTGDSTLSVVSDLSGNNALNVFGAPAPGGGVLRLDFLGGPVAGVSVDVTDATFPVVIEAYDIGDTLLGESNTGGVASSPVYESLSISLAAADIAYVIIHDSGYDYFLDNITYHDTPELASVPEPTGLALMGIGLAGIALTRRRKRSRA